jgi:hypothetical protein
MRRAAAYLWFLCALPAAVSAGDPAPAPESHRGAATLSSGRSLAWEWFTDRRALRDSRALPGGLLLLTQAGELLVVDPATLVIRSTHHSPDPFVVLGDGPAGEMLGGCHSGRVVRLGPDGAPGAELGRGLPFPVWVGRCGEELYSASWGEGTTPDESSYLRIARTSDKAEVTVESWRQTGTAFLLVCERRSKVGNASRIELHPVLEQELRRMRDAIIAEPRIPGNVEPIFRNAYGRELRDIRRQWHNAVRRAGLEDKQGISFHSTRHTFACHFLQNGAAVTDLQAILGHSNLATTQVYARMVDERMRASIRALDYGMGAAELPKRSEAI